MKKKNPPVIVAPAPSPVLHGDAFHAFIAEAQSIGNEVAVRRSFDADVTEFLAKNGLTADFNAWRAAKHAPKT